MNALFERNEGKKGLYDDTGIKRNKGHSANKVY
jgi:hypothetical protein